MIGQSTWHRGLTTAAILLGASTTVAARSHPGSESSTSTARRTAAALGDASTSLLIEDSLSGRSKKLRARFLTPSLSETFPFLRKLFGDSGVRGGVQAAQPRDDGKPFTYIAMLPFTEKVRGRIGSYRVGFWPNEQGARLDGKYRNPEGFIRVTPENQATYVSEHFRLRDFLTKDQVNVWPKYLVLDPTLIDKLELVLDDLRARGFDAKRLHVMSGFRTPQYNANGGDPRGRADLSRHQYGDAADVWVENGSGRMADLNRDGRVDTRDAAILAESAERVERAHPDLVGGVGLYKATSGHGPFVHIDTRGKRARWGGGHA